MQQQCLECRAAFEISAGEISFLQKASFKFGRHAEELPLPVQCPDCRLQIRAMHRNEQFLYHHPSALTNNQIISLYAPTPLWGEPYTVYEQDDWHSDCWNPLEYGREFDFSRPFFPQFAELHKAVPRPALAVLGNENSPYSTATAYCKNCYLITCSEYCEDCYYGKLLQNCRNCLDCSYTYRSELCYECFDIRGCYNCTFCSQCDNCSECMFSENLTGCRSCLFCSNLQRREYCISNNEVSKEEYRAAVQALRGSYAGFERAKAKWRELRRTRIHKYANIDKSENCTGDFIAHCKNCLDCYHINDSEDCRHVCVGVRIKDSCDCSNAYLSHELDYQMMATVDLYHCAFVIYAGHCHDLLYSDHVYHCHDLFGCAGLKRKAFCILNRQYSAEDYHRLVPKIIAHMRQTGEWGRFFPPQQSPFGYNESLAYEYFPLRREEVLKKGWYWRDDAEKSGSGKASAPIPDRIEDVTDNFTADPLLCPVSGQHFKVIQQELEFYRKNRIPLPRLAPFQRHKAREGLKNNRRMFPRECCRCSGRVFTNFEPERPEIIYCEKCYNACFA